MSCILNVTEARAVEALRRHLDDVNEGVGLPAVVVDARAVPGLVLAADTDLDGRPLLFVWDLPDVLAWHDGGCDEDRLWEAQKAPLRLSPSDRFALVGDDHAG